MIFCKELDKEFTSKRDMFLALKANEQKLIDLKKSNILEGREKSALSFLNADLSKLSNDEQKAFKVEDGFIYPVISTTRYMDSHLDVHFDGCFSKTVKEQQGKVFYALDHKLEFGTIAAWPKDVEMFIANIEWSLVGKDYDGTTQALIFKIAKDKVRADVLEVIEQRKADFENSIRMRYVNVRLAVDSKDKEFATNKAYYDSKIGEIANSDVAKDIGYFWGVEELGIYKEGSLVVRGGSNDATAIILSEAAQSTNENKQELDPPQVQSKNKKSNYYYTLTK